ncbi:hypothetical protein [Desulfosarcina variabilis]|uniref:hypothetical protein n=1 Tax=Desulfosarcina variabilis TaxID=2300 RepID=UPI003AFA0D72
MPESSVPAPTTCVRRKNERTATLPGILVTIIALGLLGFGAWYAGCALLQNRPMGRDVKASNENRALAHLKRIQSAQHAFCDRHPRGEYARFVPHLWQWVDPRGTPVRLDLIPRRLAMAMGATTAVDGYYFVDIRSRTGAGQAGEQAIDYNHQWAVAALPAGFGRTGRIVFLADQTGRRYATMPPRPPTHYPDDPVAAGWIVVDTKNDLKVLLH